jgi:hypothetical protein
MGSEVFLGPILCVWGYFFENKVLCRGSSYLREDLHVETFGALQGSFFENKDLGRG